MSVKIDETGRRSVQVEAEIPGTPEQVWQAIATGPGVSSWFVPCTIDGRLDGAISLNFGPGMDANATITAWEPPRRFVADSHIQKEGAPTVANEWTVEARSGGSCVVRVVHSWFAETDEWDAQYEGTELGWAGFFRDLKLYLTHFAGQPSSTVQLTGFSPLPLPGAWTQLCSALNLPENGDGEHVVSPSDAPILTGVVQGSGSKEHPEVIVLLHDPAPGNFHAFGMEMGPMTCLSIRMFLFGEGVAETAATAESLWAAWVGEHFPMPATQVAC